MSESRADILELITAFPIESVMLARKWLDAIVRCRLREADIKQQLEENGRRVNIRPSFDTSARLQC